LPTGHRFRTFHDFGIVILDILYCFAEDNGVYECRATNKLGSDSIKCSVKCSEKSGLILTPQVPGEMKMHTMERIQHLESMKMRSYTQASVSQSTAPRFTVPITNIESMKEGENAHFEARYLLKIKLSHNFAYKNVYHNFNNTNTKIDESMYFCKLAVSFFKFSISK
jgi:titin